MHLLVLINHGSGTRSKKQFLREIGSQCFDKGWSYEVRSSWYINNQQHVEAIAQQKDTVILVCGGDGTVNKVIQAFWSQKLLNKVKFVIYPGGTFNALVKNVNYSSKSLSTITDSIEKMGLVKEDLLEMTLKSGKRSRQELFHTGVLFVKDCSFTKHAARIQKALHQFDLRLGLNSFKKSLPYLDQIPTFKHQEQGKLFNIQGLYIANNPYLITKTPIHPHVKIDDDSLNVFLLKDADYFQIGQIASVLLLGSSRKLPFLQDTKKKKISFVTLEDVDMNLDGDVERLKKGTKVNIRVSRQKLQLIKYL